MAVRPAADPEEGRLATLRWNLSLRRRPRWKYSMPGQPAAPTRTGQFLSVPSGNYLQPFQQLSRDATPGPLMQSSSLLCRSRRRFWWEIIVLHSAGSLRLGRRTRKGTADWQPRADRVWERRFPASNVEPTCCGPERGRVISAQIGIFRCRNVSSRSLRSRGRGIHRGCRRQPFR